MTIAMNVVYLTVSTLLVASTTSTSMPGSTALALRLDPVASFAVAGAGGPATSKGERASDAEDESGESDSPDESDENRETKPASKEEQARRAYERGRILFEAKDYESAVVAFEEAAALYASPDFQYNLALCYERLERYPEALIHYRAYKASAGDEVDLALIEARMEALRELIRTTEQERDEAAARDEGAVGASAEPRGDEPSVDPSVTAGDRQTPAGKGMRDGGIALMVIGVAVGGGMGVGFGLAVNQGNDELEQIQRGGNPMDASFAEASDIAQRTERSETLQFIGIGIGAGVAATGAILTALGQRKMQRARELSVRPSLSPHFVGASLGGRF